METSTNFYHDGFAWICSQCERESQVAVDERDGAASRIFIEGEAESRVPDLATKAVAKWADPARRYLMCPRCGITEDTEVH